MTKMRALYRAWRRQGDVLLWRSSSTCLRDDRIPKAFSTMLQNKL